MSRLIYSKTLSCWRKNAMCDWLCLYFSSISSTSRSFAPLFSKNCGRASSSAFFMTFLSLSSALISSIPYTLAYVISQYLLELHLATFSDHLMQLNSRKKSRMNIGWIMLMKANPRPHWVFTSFGR